MILQEKIKKAELYEANSNWEEAITLYNEIVKEETGGCELCKNGQLSGTYCGGNMQLLKGSYIIHKPDGTINYQFGAIVKYCPHCGREV